MKNQNQQKQKPMKPKIDPNKKYTSGGYPVEHLHRAPDGWPGPYTWMGWVDERAMSWTDEGLEDADWLDSHFDLIEVREPLEVMVVMNCHGRPEAITSSTLNGWDTAFPQNAPHTIKKFREVIE
jgi:hypothetical protein